MLDVTRLDQLAFEDLCPGLALALVFLGLSDSGDLTRGLGERGVTRPSSNTRGAGHANARYARLKPLGSCR